MKSRKQLGLTAAIATLFVAGTTYASLSQLTTTSPGGFVQAGAYQSSCGCTMIPGQDLAMNIGTADDFEEMAFSGNSTASAGAASSSATISNSGSATVGLGFFRPQTSNTSPNEAHFAIGIAAGGWKETFTVSHPSLNGQDGFMVFRVRARGTMHTTGLTGSAGIWTAVYKDNNELAMNQYFNPGNSNSISTDRQRAVWGVTSIDSPPDRTIDDAVTMGVPITFGQSFTLGFYAFATAGHRSSGFVPGNGHGEMDFTGAGGMTWGGIVSVVHNGAAIDGFTVTSGSGIDWVPELGDGGCAADFNGDGFVNPDDLADFITCFFLDVQFPGTCADADFNSDGFRDPDDLADFITTFFLAAAGGCA